MRIRSGHRSAQRGMTLLEVMVVMVILLVLTAVLLPAGRSVFQLEQRGVECGSEVWHQGCVVSGGVAREWCEK